MGVRLLTDKLVFRRLEVLGVWSLDSATPSTSAYLAHASGSSVGEWLGCITAKTHCYNKADNNGVGIAAGIGCLLCICAIPIATPFCAAFAKVLKGIKPLPKVAPI